MAHFPAVLAWLVSASLLLLDAGTTAYAQGEHQRRFAAELRLIAGDLRRLQQESLTPLHAAGLQQRLRGSIGYLGLLGREAVQERGTAAPVLEADIARLRNAYDDRRTDAMLAPLADLLRRYPLTIIDFNDDRRDAAQRVAAGRDIDQRLCSGCHRTPDRNAANPAPDLFADARRMTREEFVARLIAGIRGVPATALDNPLSEEDLRGLYAWYRNGPSPGENDRDLAGRE